MTARFVVLEGGEGVGKTTQVALLVAAIEATGRAVVRTREPGGTAQGLALREQLLHGGALDPETELEWMLDDRRLHVEELIRPALARGAVVVCDRFSPSTIAYQGVGRGMGVAYVEGRCREAAGGVEPDVVVVLDLPDDAAEARITGTRDRFEREGAEFHAEVRNAYRELGPARGWVLVDASGTPAEVAARVRAVVDPQLGAGTEPGT